MKRGDSEPEVTKPQNVDLEIDGIEVKTKARVVIHGNFNEGVVLGKEELRCWNVRSNEVGVACLDDDSSLTVDFPLNSDVVSAVTMKGLVDTGAGPSLMSLTAWKKIARFDTYPIKNADIHLIAANGQELKTYGIVEDVKFLLAGYELRANFILMEDSPGDDFILGRTFLRKYDVLIDLRQRSLTVRDPNLHRDCYEVNQVREESPLCKVLVVFETIGDRSSQNEIEI